jgi:SAM-dependent methyltransferase
MTFNSIDNRYGSIASEIYDIDKPPGRLPDTAYYRERLEGETGPVLEPGCGSGRALVPLALDGLDLTGFDQSPDMLDRCRALCAHHGVSADLSQQDFETFRFDRRFAVIVMPMGSFSLIDDVSSALQVLQRFRDHLQPGGRLILDIPPLSALAHQADDRRSWTAANGDLLTLEGVRVKTDWVRQRSSSRLRYERWRDHRLVETQMEPMVQRFWGVEEFRLALTATGFADISVSADFRVDRRPTSGSRVLNFEARAI